MSTSPNPKSRLVNFHTVLNADEIDLQQLKALCFHGIPDDDGTGRMNVEDDSAVTLSSGSATGHLIRSLRPLCWKLLLSYLPPNRIKWPQVLQRKRQQYYDWSQEFLSNNCTGAGANLSSPTSPSQSSNNDNDHPLNLDPNSTWKTFFNDNEILLQIDKDVRRLYPEIHFFSSQTPYPHPSIVNGTFSPLTSRVNSGSFIRSSNVVSKGLGIKRIINSAANNNSNHSTSASSNSTNSQDQQDQSKRSEVHWEVIERILFLYAKLNPGQGYVQGMNEIIGPLYYVTSTDPDPSFAQYAEPDTFHLFTSLMSQSRDSFIKQLDNSHGSGIKWKMTQVFTKLQAVDPELGAKLNELKILPEYFCFRWLTLLLSQEFQLPDLLRVWDSLLSYNSSIETQSQTTATSPTSNLPSPTQTTSNNSSDFLISMSVAMIITLRTELLAGDFATGIKLLQNFPTNINVEKLIESAIRIH